MSYREMSVTLGMVEGRGRIPPFLSKDSNPDLQWAKAGDKTLLVHDSVFQVPIDIL
jgi:hypothetical protein